MISLLTLYTSCTYEIHNRSTILDSWTREQLDIMELGGNASAREAFGESVLNLKDLKSKFTSKSSLSYKNKLQKKVREKDDTTTTASVDNLINFDQPKQEPKQQQSLIDFDDLTTNTSNNQVDEFDIFKPVTSSANTSQNIFDDLATPAQPKNSNSIFDDLTMQAQPKSNNSTFDDLTVQTQPNSLLDDFDAPQQKNTNSLLDDFNAPSDQHNSSIFDELASPSINTASSVFDDLKSSTSPPSDNNQAVDDFFDKFEKAPITTPKRTFKAKTHTGRNTKLGARKVQSNVFQQQTELALREEKMREEGIDEDSINRSSRNHIMINTPNNIPKLQPPTNSSRLNYQYEPTKEENQKSEKDKEIDQERLGIMSLSLNSSSSKKHIEESNNEDTFARDKFGNAKAISSDQYFGRNDYNPERSAANSSRLSQFQGSQSISSDQFFGRKERTNNSNPISKKILRVASKGANKLQSMLNDLEVKMNSNSCYFLVYANLFFLVVVVVIIFFRIPFTD